VLHSSVYYNAMLLVETTKDRITEVLANDRPISLLPAARRRRYQVRKSALELIDLLMNAQFPNGDGRRL
jgi:hypothetical protein